MAHRILGRCSSRRGAALGGLPSSCMQPSRGILGCLGKVLQGLPRLTPEIHRPPVHGNSEREICRSGATASPTRRWTLSCRKTRWRGCATNCPWPGGCARRSISTLTGTVISARSSSVQRSTISASTSCLMGWCVWPRPRGAAPPAPARPDAPSDFTVLSTVGAAPSAKRRYETSEAPGLVRNLGQLQNRPVGACRLRPSYLLAIGMLCGIAAYLVDATAIS